MLFIKIGLFLLALISKSECLSTFAIDLGHEFIKVAIVKPGVPMEIATDKESERKTPNIVFIKDNERIFGNAAMTNAIRHPKNAYQDLLSIIGKNLSQPEVQQFLQNHPYHKLRQDEKTGQLIFTHDDKTEYSVEQLLAMILEYSAETAQNFADHPMRGLVIVVPSYFGQSERRAIMRSADLADLIVLQLLNSNTAVGLNFGIFRAKQFEKGQHLYAFFDMGSAATQLSILAFQKIQTREAGMAVDVPQISTVGYAYDSNLGARLIQRRVQQHLAEQFMVKFTKKVTKPVQQVPRAMAKLLKEAVRVVKVLSANSETLAQVENVMEDRDLRVKLTRADLEAFCSELWPRFVEVYHKALESAQLPINSITEIILMGGGSRIPKVKQILLESSKKKDLGKGINTDEAAALGAVYHAAHLTPGFRVKKFNIKDCNALPISVKFHRSTSANQQQQSEKSTIIEKVLFDEMNFFPQKKVLTFNKHMANFEFDVLYSEKSARVRKMLLTSDKGGALANLLFRIRLLNVTEIFAKYKEDMSKPLKSLDADNTDAKQTTNQKFHTESKGIKAHFRLDANGLFSLSSVEALFSKTIEVLQHQNDSASNEPSTFQKLGNTISNFFSGGDSNKESNNSTNSSIPLNNTTHNGTSTNTSTTDAKVETGNSTNSNTTAQLKQKKVNQQVIVFEPVNLEIDWKFTAEPDASHRESSLQILKRLKDLDLEKRELERSRNELESFFFEMRANLELEAYRKCSTEEERQKIITAIQHVNDWYDEQGLDTKKESYQLKLSELHEATNDLKLRVSEMNLRPAALNKLTDMLNQSRGFLANMQMLINVSKTVTQSPPPTNANTNETQKNTTTGNSNNAPPPLPAIFIDADVKAMIDVINSTEKWLNEANESFKSLKLTDTPKILSKSFQPKMEDLQREMNFYTERINLWKSYVPPPPSTSEPPPSTSAPPQSGSTKPPSKESKSEESKQEKAKSEL